MGVHDTDKYAQIRELLGIPADEPIFILRAQDVIAASAIECYRLVYGVVAIRADVSLNIRKAFSDHLLHCYTEFQRFSVRHPSAMKIPD